MALTIGDGWAAAAGPDVTLRGEPEDVVRRALALAESLAREGPIRWAWWSAAEVVPALWAAGASDAVLDRTWDVAEVHRLLAGGWRADPALAWAGAHGLDPTGVPRPTGDDLFDFVAPADGTGADSGTCDSTGAGDAALPADRDWPVGPDGYLRADAVSGRWQTTPARAGGWARALRLVAQRQEALLANARQRHCAWSESAAAVLCLELERDGLPLDRARAEQIMGDLIGPRPRDDADALRLREQRDRAVWRHVPGREGTDLRSPEQVRALLAAVGIDVPDTRKHRLAAYRGVHPVVEALLTWRAGERIATTYGYRWLDEHVGADGRLRGHWTACDGAAGRMTARNGLHNLPAALRPAVAAEPGHVLVRADLGQVEPRVLAAVSGDPAFIAATHSPDLYAPVAAELRLDRPAAKVAVLAAMYGQTSGSAGEALRRLSAAYPIAVAYLDRAYEAGYRGGEIRTYGGRRLAAGDGRQPPTERAPNEPRARAQGRYLRNAVVQGAAAELFKAWAATVRVALRPLDARLVLCLHDELVVQSPADRATLVAAAIDDALTSAAARWSEAGDVRFVADTSIVATWADAKGWSAATGEVAHER